MKPWITRSVEVAADPDTVWAMISDLPRMGEFSPENVGGVWVRGSTGPALGARFRGTNKNGALEWWTRVKVVACSPGRHFAFDVRTPFGVRVSRWEYVIAETPAGCLLTENWYRVGNWFIRKIMGPKITGQQDRPGFNEHSIEHTLAAVKAKAEAEA